ncbi:MAG: hypothetical protein CM1200mP2_27840 [Planctomycetaceae bacterium]|nr:MAG: hypothetical protein CM1200mP2_27840 [Planctomycetaceae bacterium]
MNHMRFLKVNDIERSLWIQGALAVTWVHFLPSAEDQTSRGGASNEFIQPPNSQSLFL